MNDIRSVSKSVAILRKYKTPYALLHTTNLYPTKPEWVRFGAMTQLADAFPDAVFGLSDHTTSNLACLGAVALGASILERHFTDTMDRQGPDIICSMDEKSCRELIQQSKEMALMRGGEKKALPEEKVTIDFAFATVCTTKPVLKGEYFTEDNIWVKRPGTGEILAEFYKDVLGKRASSDIPADVQLKKTDVLN
jgi:N-acetylneuraminate synthase